MVEVWATSWQNLFMLYETNKDADQPAHLCSLISIFVVRCLDSIIPILAISKISRLSLASVFEQDGLWHTWMQNLEDRFSHDVAHFMIITTICSGVRSLPIFRVRPVTCYLSPATRAAVFHRNKTLIEFTSKSQFPDWVFSFFFGEIQFLKVFLSSEWVVRCLNNLTAGRIVLSFLFVL